MNCEGIQLFDHAKWGQEAGLKSLWYLAVWNMGILDGKLEAQVPVQTMEVEVGKMPESVESFQVFKADEHAEASMFVGVCTSRGIDEDPEVKVAEILGSLSSHHRGYFTLTPDMVDCLCPWGGNLYKYIVLEDLLGLSIDLVAS